jgi:hypothetical protein
MTKRLTTTMLVTGAVAFGIAAGSPALADQPPHPTHPPHPILPVEPVGKGGNPPPGCMNGRTERPLDVNPCPIPV